MENSVGKLVKSKVKLCFGHFRNQPISNWQLVENCISDKGSNLVVLWCIYYQRDTEDCNFSLEKRKLFYQWAVLVHTSKQNTTVSWAWAYSCNQTSYCNYPQLALHHHHYYNYTLLCNHLNHRLRCFVYCTGQGVFVELRIRQWVSTRVRKSCRIDDRKD